MFSGLRSKATAIVKSLDPVEHIKFLSKQITDDPSILNQNLRDVIKHLGTGPHHERADQALGCMIAAHASRQLSTIWTVLLQTLREAVGNVRAQLCLLKHFSHIANRIAIPQRANAFRVFAKEIMVVCGSQDIVGDRQFPTACNATLTALGVHADADLARALLEKLLVGVFSWTRTDSKRAACSICATLIFGTTGCEPFSTTITNLQSAGMAVHGMALLVDSCLQHLMDQATRLCPCSSAAEYAPVCEVSGWVVETIVRLLHEDPLESISLPILVSCYSRLHEFAESCKAQKGTGISVQDPVVRAKALALLGQRETLKKILWCPLIILLQHAGLSSNAAELQAEMEILAELSECSDSMARSESLIAQCQAIAYLSNAEIENLLQRLLARHRHYSLERCHLTVKGLLRLICSCFQALASSERAGEVLHIVLRAHMDMSNTLNAMPVLQLEVLSVVEHTVGHLTGEALAYLLMCLKKGDVKVRDRAIHVLIRLCEEAEIELQELSEPTLRGTDFLEGVPLTGLARPDRTDTSRCTLSASHQLRVAHNYYTVISYLHHMLVASAYDTPKEENDMLQTVAETLKRLVIVSSGTLSGGSLPGSKHGGSPLEHLLLAVLSSLFNCISAATPYAIDSVCVVLEAIVATVEVLATTTTQFDIHFHKRVFGFAWNILVLCCEDIDSIAAPKPTKDASLYLGLVPPHPTIAMLISAAGKTAMSNSEFSQNTSFYTLISRCARLLEALMRWGHRSKICVAHLRVQHQIFLSAMDVLVSTHPTDVLRCTKQLIITTLTTEPTVPEEGTPLPSNCSHDLYERIVAAALPVLNRSLSFDLMHVGPEVFSLLETLVSIDVSAGWTTCYGAMDRSFQLFIRMVEIATDGAYYNAVAGPIVIPAIIRSMMKVLRSPHRLRALQTLAPGAQSDEGAPSEVVVDEADAIDFWEANQVIGDSQSPSSQAFQPLATVAALIDSAHTRLQCNVFSGVKALIEGDVPEVLPTTTLTLLSSLSSRHKEVENWIATTNNPKLLCQFVRSLGLSLKRVADSDEPTEAWDSAKDCLVAYATLLEKKSDPLVARPVSRLGCYLLEYYRSQRINRQCPIVVPLVAAALNSSLIGAALQLVLDELAAPPLEVCLTDVDLELLASLVESPRAAEHFDTICLQVPSIKPEVLSLDNASNVLRLRALHGLMSVLQTARWTFPDDFEGFIASAMLAPEPNTATMTVADMAPAYVSIAMRQSIAIQVSPFLYDAEIWSLIRTMSPIYSLSLSSVGQVDWDRIGSAIRAVIGEGCVLSDIRIMAACLNETLPITDFSTIETIAPSSEDLYLSYFREQLVEMASLRHCITASPEQANPTMLDMARCIPFNGRSLLEVAPEVVTVDDILEAALVCTNRRDGAKLIQCLLGLCQSSPNTVSNLCLINVVSALLKCEIVVEDANCSAEQASALLGVLSQRLRPTIDYSQSHLSNDDRLALRYACMFLLVLASPEPDGQWQKYISDPPAENALPNFVKCGPMVLEILATVLELPPDAADLKAIALTTLSIFVRSSLLLGCINESILWLVVKCCPTSVWHCVLSKELFSDTELGVLQFICKMNQTVGVGPDLLIELHARYTPLLLGYGQSKEMDPDEQHMTFWLITSLLLHIESSQERYTRPKPHMALTDSLPLYNDFPLTQMASPVVGYIRSTVDELLFPISSRLPIPSSERHWNIHARGHLLPILGRKPLAKNDAIKMYSSILHMYLHVVNSVFGGLDTFAPYTVSDTFGSLSVLASGNASLLKHSPAADGTIASNILQRLYAWYGKHAAESVSAVDKTHSAVYFGSSLFPEPSSSIEFCDTSNILTCATVISSLFTKGNELIQGAVDVSFILDKMLSMDLISNQAALTAVVVMSGSSTRKEMTYVAPLLTQRLLRELDRCMRGSLSFSFGVMQMLRTAFSILSAFPDDAVTMKVCEAVWNVVVNEGSGGRRIQHYAHYMLQSIVNLHTVSETQWSILRAIVSLPRDDASNPASKSAQPSGGSELGGSFAFANQLFSDSKVMESGRQFLSELLSSNDGPHTVGTAEEDPTWGFQPVRNTIISEGMRRRAQLSVAEAEEATTGAATVYGTTPNLLQLTTIASFVLRSHEGGEGGVEESDRNRVTILDMLKQVDDEPSEVGDAFLSIVHSLLDTVLDPTDAMFVLLNRFDFSPSSLYLFNQSLFRDVRLSATYPLDTLAMYFEAAGRRYVHADNAWWVCANILASLVQWRLSRGGESRLHDFGAGSHLGMPVSSPVLRLLCKHYIATIGELDDEARSLSQLLGHIISMAAKAAGSQDAQQEGGGSAFSAVAAEIAEYAGNLVAPEK